MIELWRGFLDLLLPRRCIRCNDPVPTAARPVPLCDEDLNGVESVGPVSCRFCARSMGEGSAESSPDEPNYPRKPICGTCRQSDLVLEFLAAGFRFGPVLHDVVADWKYDGHAEWGPWLGRILARTVEDVFNPGKWDCLTPVPMYYRRRRDRGFNQARQLADSLGDEWSLPSRRLLSKDRRTEPQSSLGRDERMRNLDNAFSLDDGVGSLEGKRLLLVDDIYTTGSTLKTAAGVLTSRGAEAVGGVVMARTPPRSDA